MRIIAGKFRSRPLKALPGMETRPTGDKLRETLFNVLTAGDPQALEGTTWLDLYAGTGAVGIEALSRGAHSITFVDSARRSAAIIRQNLKSLDIADGFEILEHEAGRALRQLQSQAFICDYCYVDPPYHAHDEYEESLGFLSQSQMLKPSSIVIAEHDKRYDLGDLFGALRRYRTLVQGDSGLSFYRLS